MQDTSNIIVKKTEPVVVYILTREPNEKESVRGDLNAAVTFEGALKAYLELRGCKRIYVNLTGYSYILRLSYVPAHCKQEDVAAELNELIRDLNGMSFGSYSDAYSYGRSADIPKLKEFVHNKTKDELQELINKVSEWGENNETN